jgi:hypothetical protein
LHPVWQTPVARLSVLISSWRGQITSGSPTTRPEHPHRFPPPLFADSGVSETVHVVVDLSVPVESSSKSIFDRKSYQCYRGADNFSGHGILGA